MRESLSQLFLEIESQIGTRDLADLVLDALIATISDFNTKNDKQFCKQFEKIIKDIKNTSPRIGLIIEDFHEIWNEVVKEEECKRHKDEPCLKCRDLKKIIGKKVKQLKKKNREDKKAIIALTEKAIKKGDKILLHTNSHTVMDALKATIRKKRFSCIVAEQEPEKTAETIKELQKARIPFKVIPEHMLSHIEKEVDKVFIGAVTLNSFHYIVSNTGTMGVVSEFKGKVPIYLLMGTRKCSFWQAKAHHHRYKEKQIKSHKYAKSTYTRIKFSHDRVPLELINKVITEQGIMSSEEMLKYYKKEFKKRGTWRRAFF